MHKPGAFTTGQMSPPGSQVCVKGLEDQSPLNLTPTPDSSIPLALEYSGVPEFWDSPRISINTINVSCLSPCWSTSAPTFLPWLVQWAFGRAGRDRMNPKRVGKLGKDLLGSWQYGEAAGPSHPNAQLVMAGHNQSQLA